MQADYEDRSVSDVRNALACFLLPYTITKKGQAVKKQPARLCILLSAVS
jgi:hypothetical protein